METLQSIFDCLSGSMNLDWRDGSFLEWILNGIPCFSPNEIEEGKGPFVKANGAFVKHFPGIHLEEGEENEDLRRLKLTLFVSYLASVKHGWQPLKKLLLGLKIPEQRVIERIFSYLLEDKWDETLMQSVKSDRSEESNVPISYSTTPIRRLKRLKSPSSPSTFNFSPSTNFPTLREFFSSPITTQISKYQRIAEDQKRILSLVRLELDQEKLETLNLLKEREELIKDRQNLKKSLAIARQNLLDNQVEMEEEDEEASYGELQRRLAEKKDSEKYINSLEDQLSETAGEKDEFKRTVNNQRIKLDEMSVQNTELNTKNIQLQVTLNLEKDMNTDLNNKCNELEVQVKELQEILNSKRSSTENAGELSSTQRKSGISVSDISLDDPMMSIPSSPEGENMANALVIPELEEQLTLTTEERDTFREKASLCEEELVLKREEVNHLSDSLNELRQCSENYKLFIENLEKEKKDISNSFNELALQKDLLQKDYEKVIMDYNSSKESIKVINRVNEDLQCKMNTLDDEITELRELNKKELNALSSDLMSSQSSLENLKSQNKALCDDIETHKSIQSKYEIEIQEQKTQIITITEELNSLKSVNENLQSEHHIISSDFQSKISSLTTTLDDFKSNQTFLMSDKDKLTRKNTDLTTQVSDYEVQINELKDCNLKLSSQVQEFKVKISTLNKDLETFVTKNSEFEKKIHHLESNSKKLEEDKLDNLEKWRCCKEESDKLIAVLKTNEEKWKNNHQELLQNNNSLIAQLEARELEVELLKQNTANLQGNCNSHEEVINSYENKLRELNNVNDNLKQDLELSREQNAATQSKSEERLNTLNKELSIVISAKVEEISNLKNENCIDQEKNLKKEEMLLESNKECEKLNSMVKSLNEEITSNSKAFDSQLRNFEEIISTHEETISSFKKDVHELKEKLITKNEEIESLNSELKCFSSQTVEISKNLKDYEECKKLSESSLLTAKESLKKYESDIKEKTDLIQNLQSKNTELNIKVSNLQKEKTEMEELSNTKISDLTIFSDELKLMRKDLNSKSEELNILTSENVKLKSEVKELKISSSLSNEAERNAKAALEEVKSNLSSKIEEMSTIQSQLNMELKEKSSEYDILFSQSNDMKTKILTLEKSLESKIVENSILQNEVIDFKNKVEAKQKEIEVLNGETNKWEINSKVETESLSAQVCELSGELDIKNKALHDLKKDYTNLKDEKSSIESANKELANQISKALGAVNNCEKEVTVINNSLSTLETENLQLRNELSALKSTLKQTESELENRDLESLSEKGEYETQLQSYKDDLKTVKEEYSSGELSLQNKFNERIEKLKGEMEAKSRNDLAAQKSRYEVRVKDIAEKVAKQYKDKIEQFAKEKDSELEKLSQKSQDFEKKYNIAKVKISELVSKLEQMTKENSALQKKYTGTKSMILKLKEENENTLNKYSNEASVSMEIETLKRQLTKVQTENRQLNVQFSTAELKIRSLQKEVTTLNSQQTCQSVLPSSRMSPPRAVFKVPTSGDTPGRTRNGRTQSESHFHSRRPPNGVGALFNVDDEEGEMFSNSYLSDVKEGICAVNESGRLSELCRRNTLQPLHLKSSYPIETQFYNTDQYKENEIQEGKVLTDVRSITKGTANLSMNSPAMNTRSRRTTIGGPSSNVSPLSTRKRAVLDNSSFNSNTSSFIRYEAKRSRKEAQQTSYSKPGPPTPAKNKSFHSNSSMNRSSTSDIAGLENTPNIRSQSPNVSNRSLRSRIVDTPLTLRRAVRSAWRKKKSYNMKGKVEENASVVVLEKKRTPLKRLDKRK